MSVSSLNVEKRAPSAVDVICCLVIVARVWHSVARVSAAQVFGSRSREDVLALAPGTRNRRTSVQSSSNQYRGMRKKESFFDEKNRNNLAKRRIECEGKTHERIRRETILVVFSWSRSSTWTTPSRQKQELQNEINYINDSRDFQDAESVRSEQSHVTSQPVFFPLHPDPGGMLSRSLGMPRRNNGPPDTCDTHGTSGNVFVNPRASSSSPYPGGYSILGFQT